MQKSRTNFRGTMVLGMIVVFSAYAMDGQPDLKIVSGNIRLINSKNDGSPCPFENQLIEEARRKALSNLGNQDNFKQVSPWQDETYFDYYLVIRSQASFEHKNSGNDLRQVTTEGSIECNSRDPQEPAFERAYQEALKKARFFCNGEVVLPPSNIKKTIESNSLGDDGPGHFWAIYRATFQCIRSKL
jgi:hypothetical protein